MEDQTSTNRKRSIDVLFVLLSTILLILAYRYMNFLWRRRRLYILSWNTPGPLAFPFWGNAHLFRGLSAITKSFDDLARAYPEIFRLWMGPELVYCILKPEYIQNILCNNLDRADWVNQILSETIGGSGLLVFPVSIWKSRRKLILPSFGQTILNSHVEKFNDGAEILRDQLQKHVMETNFGLREKVIKFAAETICDSLIGVRVYLGTKDSDIGNDLCRIIKIATKKVCGIFYHIDIIWKLSRLYSELNYLRNKMKNSYLMCEIYDKINRRQKNYSLLDKTQEESKKKLPFLDWILKTSDLTETEIKHEIDIFMVAGSDTVTTTICCGMITMGMYQDIQEKVYQEVMEICGPNRRVAPSDINKLKYTERVIKETLRLFPSVPFMLRKIDADLDLGGHTLPGGSSCIFSIRTIHTNPKYWPNPYEFDPDRFLPENVAKRHPCAYIPFSYGSRNCIGGRYAMMKLLTTFAILIRRFKFFTEYKTIEDIKLIPTIILELKDGDKVRLELR